MSPPQQAHSDGGQTAEPRPLPGPPLPIDLLNTTWLADGAEYDWLANDGAVAAFTASYDLATFDAELARSHLRRARDLVGRLFVSRDRGSDESLDTDVDDLLSRARLRLRPDRDHRATELVADDADEILAIRAVADAIRLLESNGDRIRSCDHPQCVLWFVDTSKAGRRRWCSMDRCGNRAKAKRHYERTADPAAKRS